MGWFDEQIRQRKLNDDRLFEEAFADIAGAVTGSKVYAALNDFQKSKDAIEEILKFYHVRASELPENIEDLNEQLEYLLRPHGIMRRTVILDKGWYKDAIGAMLAVRKSDGLPVALIPAGMAGYTYYDAGSGRYIKINRKNQDLFEEEAIAFYNSFPLRKLGISDLMRYIVHTLSVSDFVMVGIATLAVTLIGLLTPKLTNLMFSEVLDSGSVYGVRFGKLHYCRRHQNASAGESKYQNRSCGAGGVYDESFITSRRLFQGLQRRRAFIESPAYKFTLQHACFDSAFHRTYLCVFTSIYFADF